jgi:hypothetical protein
MERDARSVQGPRSFAMEAQTAGGARGGCGAGARRVSGSGATCRVVLSTAVGATPEKPLAGVGRANMSA